MNNKKKKRWKYIHHQLSSTRRELKKRSAKFHKRRSIHISQRKNDIMAIRKRASKDYVTIKAPNRFSFIENTDDVLEYFNSCKELLHKNENVECDISNIDSLTSDAIALLAAYTNDKDFLGKYGNIRGNAPLKPDLNQIFRESGFYKFFNANRSFKQAHKPDKNMFHQESNYKVQSEIAKQACMLGTKHVFANERPFPELYEMIVEAMSNTNNHASKGKEKQVKWWLYTYISPIGNAMYTFIDLGVGIFDSIPVQKYKQLFRKLKITHNADLVDDLLSGKIKSRVQLDNNIRGKGIPQIARNSSQGCFKQAYLISNNVKINLKNREVEKLKQEFNGTFLFWELQNVKK